jgi:hypothetical protein
MPKTRIISGIALSGRMWLWKNCAIVIPAYPCDVLFLRAFFAITFSLSA